ncbi:HK97 family phage prohead protease [Novosphingobium lentum]|uniref:HK97 family phage prohead protease n=1 Tax=Novosphingobium lentum TaxID=145287 RepID=UPI00083157BE|nr:HK97 family phage prohead protease [Novosphingobium lentum]
MTDPTHPATPAAGSAPVRFAGYAAIFGKRDSGGDVILPGAFAATLSARAASGQPLPLFWQHRPDRPIGWIDTVAEDARGLRVTGTLSDPAATGTTLLRAGSVNGLSFGYRATAAHGTPEGRTLQAVDLVEVSLVTRPMQPMARVHFVAG